MLLRSVVITRLGLVVLGLVVLGLLVDRPVLWIPSWLIRSFLVVVVAGSLVDGLHSWRIGIAHGLIAVGSLLLLLQLEFHLEQLNFLLLQDEFKFSGGA